MDQLKLKNKTEGILEQYAFGLIDFETTTEKIMEIIEKEIDIVQPIVGGADAIEYPTITFVKNWSATLYDIDVFWMGSKSRKNEHSEPRQIAMYLCCVLCNPKFATLKAIGKEFGKRHHSTVLYSKQTVEGLMDVDKQFKSLVLITKDRIEQEFKKTLV